MGSHRHVSKQTAKHETQKGKRNKIPEGQEGQLVFIGHDACSGVNFRNVVDKLSAPTKSSLDPIQPLGHHPSPGTIRHRTENFIVAIPEAKRSGFGGVPNNLMMVHFFVSFFKEGSSGSIKGAGRLNTSHQIRVALKQRLRTFIRVPGAISKTIGATATIL